MPYDGGKGGAGVTQWIINQIPPHRVYIEPFLGGGAVLRAKLPAATSTIGVERDARAVSLWRGDEVPEFTVIHGDAISWLSRFAAGRVIGDEFIYCDPPYMLSTRTGGAIYRYTLSDHDHLRLLKILRSIRCSIAISGYWSELYERTLRGWRLSRFATVKRNHARAEECLWMNYPEPIALHDYRYLGNNFRERERIKRKKTRWKNRLAAMSILERRALVATLAECDAERSCNAVLGEAGRRSLDVGNRGSRTFKNGDATRLGSYRRKRRSAPARIAGNGEE